MEVKLYALSTCPYCRMTKKYLEDHGTKYDLVEVDKLEGEERQKAVDEVKRISGGSSFPVLLVDDKHVTGFNKSGIADLLGY
jgi:glutaredoxin